MILRLFKNISFFIVEKLAFKIIDVITSKNNTNKESIDIDSTQRLLIEEARIISQINYEIERTNREIEKIKTILYAIIASNIIAIIILVIIAIKK